MPTRPARTQASSVINWRERSATGSLRQSLLYAGRASCCWQWLDFRREGRRISPRASSVTWCVWVCGCRTTRVYYVLLCFPLHATELQLLSLFLFFGGIFPQDWLGLRTEIFNAGNYRRRVSEGCRVPASFFDPTNEEARHVQSSQVKRLLIVYRPAFFGIARFVLLSRHTAFPSVYATASGLPSSCL